MTYSIIAVLTLVLQTIIFKIPESTCDPADLHSLLYSQVICRHGNRNPLNTYGQYTENYKLFWPEGVGELTELGKEEAYKIGQFLRTRYDGFLDRSYKSNEIFILSSATERTTKTALNSMLGLYKGNNDEAAMGKGFSQGQFSAQPIPVRTVPSELDNILSLDAKCPKRSQSIEDNRNSSFDPDYFQNDGTWEYVLRNTGQQLWLSPNATDVDKHWEFYNALEVIVSLQEQNKTLEDWMLPLLSNERYLAYKYHLIEQQHANDLQTHRLHIGALMKLLSANLNSFEAGTREKKIDVFIGHDKNLLSLGWTLAINATFGNRMPPPASCILLELHKLPKNDEPVLQFWFRKGSDDNVQRAASSYCGDPCSLNDFFNMTADVMDVNFEIECQLV